MSRDRCPLFSRIKIARIQSEMSQEELAAASGIGAKTISSFETGERIDGIKVLQLERIAKALGFEDLVEFLSWDPLENEGEWSEETLQMLYAKETAIAYASAHRSTKETH